MLDSSAARAYGRVAFRNGSFGAAIFNLIKEHMGSTRYGIAGSARLTGPALPQHMNAERAGGSRVGICGRS